MRPTTPELISAIVASLERQVAQHITDKWAASALRSAAQLLNHIALRTQGEAQVLEADNLDVRQVLATVLARLEAHAEFSAARRAVEGVLAGPESGAPTAGGPEDRNESYQALVEMLLNHAAIRVLEQGAVHRILRDYLRRRLKREYSLYFPVFTSPPF